MIVVVISISLMVFCVVLLIGEARKHRAMGTSKQRESPPGHTLKSARVNSVGLAWMISLPVLCLSIVAYGWLYPRALFLTFVPSPGFITRCLPPSLQRELRSAHLARFQKHDRPKSGRT